MLKIFFARRKDYPSSSELLRKILNENGIFIYEHIKDKPSVEIEGFKIVNTKKYGLAVFDFYQLA